MKEYKIKNINLAGLGKKKILWAREGMPVLQYLEKKYSTTKPMRGMVIAACMHVTSETANLMILLKKAGAQVRLSASNPLSTQDEIAASLVKDYGISVFAVRGANRQEYFKHLQSAITPKTNFTMDDGADLVKMLHSDKRNLLSQIWGGTEETTTGVIRLKALAGQGKLAYPIVAVNDAMTKHFFDNRYGTGQSTVDGIIRATNVLLAGKTLVIAGYGWCGRGVAMRARGHGADVIITEVDPVRALEAKMDGLRVMTMNEAVKQGDIFVTATGDIHVLDQKHFKNMKTGAILANTGHFDVEINMKALRKIAKSVREVRPNVVAYELPGRILYVLAEGRLVNLSAAEGHPAQVMDMSFAGQFMAAKFVKENKNKLKPAVYNLPIKLDNQIAELKLKTMGIGIDRLTPEQAKYLASWEVGT
jgi:adenosylhomocysteinase